MSLRCAILTPRWWIFVLRLLNLFLFVDDRREKTIKIYCENNKKQFANIHAQYLAEIKKLKNENLENTRLIQQLMEINNQNHKLNKSSKLEIENLRKDNQEKTLKIKDMIRNSVFEDTKPGNQPLTHNFVDRYYIQVNQFETITNDLKANLLEKENEIQSLKLQNEKLLEEMKVREVALEKFVSKSEHQLNIAEEGWELKLQELQIKNNDLKRQFAKLEAAVDGHLNTINSKTTKISELEREILRLKKVVEENRAFYEANIQAIGNQRRDDLSYFNAKLLEKEQELQQVWCFILSYNLIQGPAISSLVV